ncbi:MAG: hypothetical protein R3F15_05345 [Lysobacterales bacterium]
MTQRVWQSLCGLALALPALAIAADQDAAPSSAPAEPIKSAVFRGTHQAVKFDVSIPLRDMTPKPIPTGELRGGSIVDPDGDLPNKPSPLADQPDGAAQLSLPAPRIPAPTVSFDGPDNVSGVAPPDPVGDVGPDHYVAMSNLFFQIYDKSGTSLFGPAANNTLWSGFGGACENENSGDPIVLYDQFADRWLLTQFTSAGPEWFNCVALSQTSDPTGAYFRWAFTTGGNFPDYPKYGIWSDAYVISTREFAGGSSYTGVGAYAIDRDAMIAGNPNPVVIDFFVDRTTPRLVGDGLLPADIDGSELPPNGAPHYMLGTQDDGGPYGATEDALLLWKFVIDFDTPANSSFTLTDTLPIANFDTQFSACSGRSCIPQMGTTNRLDILSYRQRPLHRLAYRNFGTHESLVTTQSVEGATGIAGMRWWELRDPDGTPVIFQEGTFVPGATDGVHRWMGSAAQDSSGNIAIAYSASSATMFPSIRYSGRLVGDPLGTLDQGEESIIEGTGAQTAGGSRWGDYTSLNLDPLDDCTFWHVNEYVPTTSSSGWRLRIGAFRFDECGAPGFVLGTPVGQQSICVGTDATFGVNVTAIGGFAGDVDLVATGAPAGTTASFSVNPVTAPGSSDLTITNTGGAAAGSYPIDIVGSSLGVDSRTRTVTLDVFDAIPGVPVPSMPADMATAVEFRPAFSWSDTGAQSYHFELATDPAFTDVILDSVVATTTLAPDFDLNSNSTFYWRVSAANICGDSASSTVFSFTTAPAPGDCATEGQTNVAYDYGFEAGASGWTSSGTGNTWAQSGDRMNTGTFSWKAVDPNTTSDQRLVSPPIALPSGETPLTLQFFHFRDIEESGTTQCWDGGLLEVSVDGGTNWTQVANTDLLTDPYNGDVRAGTSTNPLAGLLAWCNLQDWTKSVVDIDAFAGQTAQFRFRLGSDGSVGQEGWYIDDVKVQSCRDESFIFEDGFEN